MIGVGIGTGRHSDAASGAAAWLGLAAAPMFAVMAMLTYMSDGDAVMLLCSAGHGASPLSGMAPMYVLMSVFHSMPWVRLIAGRHDAATKKAES